MSCREAKKKRKGGEIEERRENYIVFSPSSKITFRAGYASRRMKG